MKQQRNGAGRGLRAFTLIELLIVIAIMGILAALLFPVMGGVNRAKIHSRARSELKQVETFIEGYKTKLGHYPPNDPNNNPALNPLFYELSGTKRQGGAYTTLDGNFSIKTNEMVAIFGTGIAGFVNSTQGLGSDDAPTAQKFLTQVRPGSFGVVSPIPGYTNVLLAVSIDGPVTYVDVNTGVKFNPVRYNSVNPTNNPQSYDLWIDVLVGGKTNRISNWSADPIKL
jgi:prepilin-type N-terminal cleavage/methylation domain-containing protein